MNELIFTNKKVFKNKKLTESFFINEKPVDEKIYSSLLEDEYLKSTNGKNIIDKVVDDSNVSNIREVFLPIVQDIRDTESEYEAVDMFIEALNDSVLEFYENGRLEVLDFFGKQAIALANKIRYDIEESFNDDNLNESSPNSALN